jgi:hypothetical protein
MQMNSILRLFLSTLVISGVLFFTNPEKKDFIAWATLKLYSYGNQQAGFLGAGIAGLVGGPALNQSITRENYYLFSVFVIDNPMIANAVTESAEKSGKTTMIGLFNPFIYFPISQSTQDFFKTISFSKKTIEPTIQATKSSKNEEMLPLELLTYMKNNFADSPISEWSIKLKQDMNRDGKEDLLLYSNGQYCGNGGCTHVLYFSSPSGFKIYNDLWRNFDHANIKTSEGYPIFHLTKHGNACDRSGVESCEYQFNWTQEDKWSIKLK